MAAAWLPVAGALVSNGDPRALLGDSHKAVSPIFPFDDSDAGIGQVEADQLRAVSGEPVKQLATRRGRLIGHMVGGWPPVRMSGTK